MPNDVAIGRVFFLLAACTKLITKMCKTECTDSLSAMPTIKSVTSFSELYHLEKRVAAKGFNEKTKGAKSFAHQNCCVR